MIRYLDLTLAPGKSFRPGQTLMDHCMKELTLKKGFKLPLPGKPDTSIIQLKTPETVAASAADIPYIRPRVLVKKNDPVKIGTPLFCDKRNPQIQYLSPGSGIVQDIVFGPRRRLIEVVIRLDVNEERISFDKIQHRQLEDIPTSDLAVKLQQGGLWQCFRQFPSKDTADPEMTPPMIIVSLNGNDLFSPHPAAILENEILDFFFGMALLRKFTSRVVVTARKSSLPKLKPVHTHITHVVPDTFPAWDPGVVLYHLKTDVKENHSWCISAEHLILMARLLLTGEYPVKRVVTVTRADDKKPHIITRQGAPIRDLAGQLDQKSVITTGRFNGRIASLDSHLGFFDTTLNIIRKGPEDEWFGFMSPGLSKPSLSNTFASSLAPRPLEHDSNFHGEERACINCGYCAKICPVDLAPSFIMKSLHADDIEDALGYGILDCCRCGLCSYVCPSKIELAHLLSQGMDAHFKDKE